MEKYVPDTLKTNELETWIADLHSIKTNNFLALLNRCLIPLRPGIARLIQ